MKDLQNISVFTKLRRISSSFYDLVIYILIIYSFYQHIISVINKEIIII